MTRLAAIALLAALLPALATADGSPKEPGKPCPCERPECNCAKLLCPGA